MTTPPPAETSTPERNERSLRLLFAYRLVSRSYFHLPVLFVFFYVHDLRVDVIAALLAL